ncbi:CAP domain-containing protein [Clostridium sp. AM58-1XD]|uniref:CAP domain-containing protein n=1 Tax=Clostridium sp. AM58-1XD TaxID=2292307 RepID=UPI000E491B78|nr:CAP domain-containing protein [Clostridium sp. AM58-1XD]RGZ01527.1 hypothetical protein DXA13_01420 [Clostridium sp. AM58-1XD]
MKKIRMITAAFCLSAAVTVTSYAGAWKQEEAGWKYEEDNGTYAAGGLKTVDGFLYCFDNEGRMTKGWTVVEGKYYYLEPFGNYCNGIWLPEGALWTSSWTPDGWYVDRNGVWDEAAGQRPGLQDETITSEPEDGGTFISLDELEKNENFRDSLAEELIGCVNKRRRNAGLKKLKTNEKLMKLAKVRALELASSYTYSRPDDSGFETLFLDYDMDYRICGQSISGGGDMRIPEAVENSWNRSEADRDHILNKKFEETGAACYCINGFYYWVELYYTES